MIKFFRKIRQNLLKENKTGKYFKYAIGEIFLVMLGILLALQVNNWNENRVARVRIEGRLMNMISELEYDIEEIDRVLQVAKNRIIVNKAILAGANLNGSFKATDTIFSEPIIESFSNPNAILSNSDTFDGSQSTYKAFVNSGEFYQMKNQYLAHIIQIYYEKINNEIFERELIITDNWEKISNSKHRLGIGTYRTLNLSELIEMAKTDKQFGAELEHLYSLDHWQYNYITQLRQDAKALQQEIERSIQ